MGTLYDAFNWMGRGWRQVGAEERSVDELRGYDGEIIRVFVGH